MTEQEAEQVEESGGDVEAQGNDLADAVDDRAAELTGSAAAADAADPVIADSAGAVAEAEAHLEENTDLAEDRDTLKKLQSQM